MFVAIVKNGVIGDVGNVRDLFKNTSFTPAGPSKSFLEDNNCIVITAWKAHDSLVEKLEAVKPYLEKGEVFTVKVVALTQEEINAAKQSAMLRIKKQRNDLLAGCDWTQTPDATVDKAAWLAYRALLRDFPSTVTDPRLPIEFPKDPNWVPMFV